MASTDDINSGKKTRPYSINETGQHSNENKDLSTQNRQRELIRTQPNRMTYQMRETSAGKLMSAN